jgi:hypothetical protein
MSERKTRITASIGVELARKFTEITRRIGISGTALLSRTLPTELNYLAQLPGNSARAEMGWRLMEKLDETPPKTRRFNVTLYRDDAERMDQLCRERRVRRDSFINGYIGFLVNGEDGVCEAPLKRIGEMLMNPRHEFEEMRRNSPAEDPTASNLKDKTFASQRGVSQANPYSYLHLDAEQLTLLERIARDRRPETR